MTLRVQLRPDTRTLWIVGTVRPAGIDVGYLVRRSARTNDRELAERQAAELERSILESYWSGDDSLSQAYRLPPPILLGRPDNKKRRQMRGYSTARAADGNARSDDPTSLYVVGCAGKMKVGISSTLGKRLKSLEAHCPLPIEFHGAQEVRRDVAAWAEYLSHLALSDCHSHGEWFACGPERALAVARDAAGRANAVPFRWILTGNRAADWIAEAAHKTEALQLADMALHEIPG